METKKGTKYLVIKQHSMNYCVDGTRLIPRTKLYSKGGERVAIVERQIPLEHRTVFKQELMTGKDIKKCLGIKEKGELTIE